MDDKGLCSAKTTESEFVFERVNQPRSIVRGPPYRVKTSRYPWLIWAGFVLRNFIETRIYLSGFGPTFRGGAGNHGASRRVYHVGYLRSSESQYQHLLGIIVQTGPRLLGGAQHLDGLSIGNGCRNPLRTPMEEALKPCAISSPGLEGREVCLHPMQY